MNYIRILLLVVINLISYEILVGQSLELINQNLENSSYTPPNSARPQTWWHWMNGNVTQEGIKVDLEALTNIRVGGAQILELGASYLQLSL